MTKTAEKTASSTRRNGVQSIEVGARLLDVLTEHLGPMHLRDIAAAAGMSSSKAHRYLISLLRAGLAEQDMATGRYDLGPMCARIGLAALNRHKVVQYATQACIELNQDEDLTVALTIWGSHGPTIIGWYDSSQILICNLHVGSVLPLLRSAAGQVFLAYQPRLTTQGMVDRELQMISTYLPHASVRTRGQVEVLVQTVRKARLGMTNEDLVPGLSAFAAPVFDHMGHAVAAISTIGPSGLVNASGSNAAAKNVLRAADTVSLKLGCTSLQVGASFAEKLERHEYAGGATQIPATGVQETAVVAEIGVAKKIARRGKANKA